MGYRGRVADWEKARELRARAWTLGEIAEEVGAGKGAVSVWVRDVEFDEAARQERAAERNRRGAAEARLRGPNALQRRKQAQIEAMQMWGTATVGDLSDRDLMIAGVALYAGEGAKRDGSVKFANTDPRMVRLFCAWLRRFFEVDERRLRVRLYLHEGLDLAAAVDAWSTITGVPASQFGKPYRAVPDATIRKAKHIHGCACVVYNCAKTHRAITGLMDALLSSEALPG